MRTSIVVIAVIFAVCVSGFLPSADALQCYQCNSSKNADCKVPVKEAKQQCTGPVNQCNEVVIQRTNGEYVIKRGCHTPTSCKQAVNANVIECRTCTGDLCNKHLVVTPKK